MVLRSSRGMECFDATVGPNAHVIVDHESSLGINVAVGHTMGQLKERSDVYLVIGGPAGDKEYAIV